MQPGIGTLIILDVNGNLWASLQMGAARQFVAFGISPDHVVLLAHGYALLEFAAAVGIKLPPRFLVSRPPNVHLDARHRTVIRSPDCSEDQRIIVRLRPFAALQYRTACKEY